MICGVKGSHRRRLPLACSGLRLRDAFSGGLFCKDEKVLIGIYMGGCPNYGPFLGTLNISCRNFTSNPEKAHDFVNLPY